MDRCDSALECVDRGVTDDSGRKFVRRGVALELNNVIYVINGVLEKRY